MPPLYCFKAGGKSILVGFQAMDVITSSLARLTLIFPAISWASAFVKIDMEFHVPMQ